MKKLYDCPTTPSQPVSSQPVPTPLPPVSSDPFNVLTMLTNAFAEEAQATNVLTKDINKPGQFLDALAPLVLKLDKNRVSHAFSH